MLPEIIKQFNWLDILIILIFIRICFVSLKTGFLVEIFKFLGIVTAVYCSLHYYTTLSDFLQARLGLKTIPLEFLDFVSAILLALLGCLLFFAVRVGFERIIKMETTPKISQAGGLLLGLGRALLLVSLVTFFLAISSVDYFKKIAVSSYSGSKVIDIAPNTYTWLWNSIGSRFMTEEEYNKLIPKIQKELKE